MSLPRPLRPRTPHRASSRAFCGHATRKFRLSLRRIGLLHVWAQTYRLRTAIAFSSSAAHPAHWISLDAIVFPATPFPAIIYYTSFVAAALPFSCPSASCSPFLSGFLFHSRVPQAFRFVPALTALSVRPLFSAHPVGPSLPSEHCMASPFRRQFSSGMHLTPYTPFIHFRSVARHRKRDLVGAFVVTPPIVPTFSNSLPFPIEKSLQAASFPCAHVRPRSKTKFRPWRRLVAPFSAIEPPPPTLCPMQPPIPSSSCLQSMVPTRALFISDVAQMQDGLKGQSRGSLANHELVFSIHSRHSYIIVILSCVQDSELVYHISGERCNRRS